MDDCVQIARGVIAELDANGGAVGLDEADLAIIAAALRRERAEAWEEAARRLEARADAMIQATAHGWTEADYVNPRAAVLREEAASFRTLGGQRGGGGECEAHAVGDVWKRVGDGARLTVSRVGAALLLTSEDGGSASIDPMDPRWCRVRRGGGT